MPTIEELQKTKTRKFKKSNYRPWNFLEELEREEREADSTTPDKNSATPQQLNNETEKKQTTATKKNTEKNQGQAGDKLETRTAINGKQTVNKPYTQPETNGKQTVNKPLTNGKQTVNKPYTQPETNGKQTVNKPLTNGKQTVNKPGETFGFSSLAGIQQKIIISLYQNCRMYGGRVTQEMTLDHISGIININKDSIKTSIFRLKGKGIIKTIEYKDGRGGWSKYEISQNIFTELLHNENNEKLAFPEHNGKQTVNKPLTNGKQTVNKPYTQPYTQPETNVSSSSSNNINTTTTELPAEWKNVDLLPLKDIGFSFSHLSQLFRDGNLTPQIVQDSIYHFAFDLEHNNKANEIQKSAIGYFMGILKRIGLYNAPENYESPQDKAMRLYLEQQRDIAAKRKRMETEAFELAFRNWFSEQGEAELKQLLPAGFKFAKDSKPLEGAAREHFKNTIWLEQKQSLLS